MKNRKRLKIVLSGLILIQSLFLPCSLRGIMAFFACSGNSGSVLVVSAGQTDVSARIVTGDSEPADLPQGDETDGNMNGAGEPVPVENRVGTGDDWSAAGLLICVTAVLGVMLILLLGVRKRQIR